jgi:saccharopine dehydrogenase-like NADP-dependent oxidoreductase
MRIIILGHGNIGSIVAADLAENMPSAQVVMAGVSLPEARKTASAIRRENVSGMRIDAKNRRELVSALEKCDLAVGALPGDIGYRSMEAAIEAGVSMVDISYMPENPLGLDRMAEEAGVTVVPDCGVAPGISNTLIGNSLSKLDKVEGIFVMVGGLPEEPVPPLGYTLTWSTEGLIDEYTRTVTIVKDGKIVEVEALTGLETVKFPGVGELEGFYTDGLRTLLCTVKGARNMWERTLRYPGHVEKIRVLKALGFFDEQPRNIEGLSVAPRKLAARLFDEKLRKPDVKDILALKVEVNGLRAKEKTCFVHYLLDRYDEKRDVTAMARTTAYPASILAQLIAKGEVREKGVVTLEELGKNEEIFKKVMNELEKRHIKVVSQSLT